MRKVISQQILTLFISFIMHHDIINTMKREINEINNYQKISIKTPSQKLKSEAQFSCYICYKEFARKDYLTKHMKIHIRKKSYSRLPLELRIKNAFVKKFNIRVPTHVPTQHFTYMPLEDLPLETAIQELEWT